MQHHEDTTAAYAKQVAADSDTVALVVVGSVARGTERPDSDVDVSLVLTEEAYRQATAEGRVAGVDRATSTYGSYVDIKLTSLATLAGAVEAADDPTRASYAGARVVLDRSGQVADLVRRITELPAEQWDSRVHTQRCQAALYGGYFLHQASASGDEFLLRHSAVHLCLAAGRVALAAHRRFFPGQKYLSAILAELPDLPAGFRAAWSMVLPEPTPDRGDALNAIMDSWFGGPLDVDDSLSTFVTDNELAWLHGRIPPEFR